MSQTERTLNHLQSFCEGNIARLYEQGASEERVGRYRRRWLGWVGVSMFLAPFFVIAEADVSYNGEKGRCVDLKYIEGESVRNRFKNKKCIWEDEIPYDLIVDKRGIIERIVLLSNNVTMERREFDGDDYVRLPAGEYKVIGRCEGYDNTVSINIKIGVKRRFWTIGCNGEGEHNFSLIGYQGL